VLKAVVAEYHGKVLLAKVDTEEDENLKLAGRYKVRGFPTVVLIEKGEEVARFSSARTKPFVREFLDDNSQLLAAATNATHR
jgi:putative thioredoxin